MVRLWEKFKRLYRWYEKLDSAAEIPKWVNRTVIVFTFILAMVSAELSSGHPGVWITVFVVTFGAVLMAFLGILSLHVKLSERNVATLPVSRVSIDDQHLPESAPRARDAGKPLVIRTTQTTKGPDQLFCKIVNQTGRPITNVKVVLEDLVDWSLDHQRFVKKILVFKSLCCCHSPGWSIQQRPMHSCS